MMIIDMTHELSHLLTGLNVALVVSGLALFANGVLHFRTRPITRPRLTLTRPVLAGAR